MLLTCVVLVDAASVGAALVTIAAVYHVCFDRESLSDLGPFTRFEFPTVGHVYDTKGRPLIELARECRHNTQYADIPAVIRDAILAAADKHFFSHNGVDYLSIPRIIGKGGWRPTGSSRSDRPDRDACPLVNSRGQPMHVPYRWSLLDHAQSTTF